MKKINKGLSPVWFENWKAQFEINNGRKPQYKGDFSTDDASGTQRRYDLKKSLIEEQGGICCYCMGRIYDTITHIEHFWPKGVSQFAHLDLDYKNLFASCEGKRVSQNKVNLLVTWDEHCGHKKEDWYDENMIIPTDSKIENIFTYWDNGEIHAIEGRTDSNIANKMRTELGLDSFHLNRNRQEAIEQMYEELDEDLMFDADYIRENIDYYSSMIDGKYMPYCGALVNCLKRWI